MVVGCLARRWGEMIFTEHRDNFFRIPRLIFNQKHPFFNEKKILDIFFPIYEDFLPFFLTFFTTTTSLSQLYRFRRKKIATYMLKMVAFTF